MPVFQENYEFDLTEKICRASKQYQSNLGLNSLNSLKLIVNKAGSEVIKTMEIQSGCKILVSLGTHPFLLNI